MANPGKRPLKRKIVILPGEQGSDTSGGFRVRLDAKTLVAVAAFLFVAAALVFFLRMPEGPSFSPTGGTNVGTTTPEAVRNGRPADAQTVQNRPPSVVMAAITTSDPGASTPLQIQFSASDADEDAVTVEIKWYVDNALVLTGPSNVLQPGAYHKGSSVYAEVIPTDQQSSGNTYKTSPVIIKNSPPRISALILEPENAAVGDTVSAIPSGTDPDGDTITYAYQWKVNGNNVGAAGGDRTFTTAGLRKNDVINAAVTCTDGTDAGVPVLSSSIRMQNRSPKITSSAPPDLRASIYVYQVTASDPDGDGLTYRLDRFPSGMSIDASSGLIRWELAKGQMFSGRNEVAATVTVDDGDGGRDSQEFTIVITDLYIN